MDLGEYIDTVTTQMRCKKAHSMVAKELADHIEDQKQAYIEAGMDNAKAEEEAVRQMGDAVEVGLAMDRIHRPRINVKMLALIGVFSVAACILQGMMVAENSGGKFEIMGIWESALQVAVGVLLMTAVLFLDYTWIGKKPLAVWVILFLAVPALRSLEMQAPAWLFMLNAQSLVKLQRYLLTALMLPAYGGVIYYYRRKGARGFVMCFLWLGAAVVFNSTLYFSRTVLVLNAFGCLLLLTLAVAAGWMQVRRIPALLASWGTIACGLSGMLFYTLNFGVGYQRARLTAFFSGGEGNYITEWMRLVLENLRIFGHGKMTVLGTEGPWEGANALLFFVYKAGIAAGILLIAGLILLFVMMAAGILKQKSVLGGLVGTACLLGLFLPSFFHLLNNLTLIPYAEVYIPFLYPGWIVNAACYTLLGLYLSVYRNTDIVE